MPPKKHFNAKANPNSEQQAAHYHIIKDLIKNGTRHDIVHYVEQHDVDLLTPTSVEHPDPYLHLAVMSGKTEMVDLFMALGCDPMQVNKFNETLIDTACQMQHIDMLHHLAQYSECLEQINGRPLSSPLAQTVMDRDIEMFDILHRLGADINVPGIGGQTPIVIAVRQDHCKFVKKLHEAGADLAKAEDVRGNNLLILAIMNGAEDIIPYLLSQNVDPNHVNDYGGSPLYYAAQGNKKDIFDQLIAAGADLQARNDKGQTLLHQAVMARHFGAVHFLLEQGVDPKIRDKSGRTARELALGYSLTNIAYALHPDQNQNQPKRPKIQSYKPKRNR